MKEAADRAASCVGRPPRTMTAMGQKRRFGRERAMSGLAPTTVVLNVASIFAYGPTGEVR